MVDAEVCLGKQSRVASYIALDNAMATLHCSDGKRQIDRCQYSVFLTHWRYLSSRRVFSLRITWCQIVPSQGSHYSETAVMRLQKHCPYKMDVLILSVLTSQSCCNGLIKAVYSRKQLQIMSITLSICGPASYWTSHCKDKEIEKQSLHLDCNGISE